jgi:hypothetical protein
MSSPTEFYQWWIVDDRTSELRRTPYKLTRADAQRAFAGAQSDLATREVRDLIGADDTLASRRPGGSWSRWN